MHIPISVLARRRKRRRALSCHCAPCDGAAQAAINRRAHAKREALTSRWPISSAAIEYYFRKFSYVKITSTKGRLFG